MHAPPSTYCIEPGIWAGSYIGAGLDDHTEAHIAWLLAEGIGCIVDLSSPDDQLPSYLDSLARLAPGICHCSFPVRDGAAPSPAAMAVLLEQMAAFQHRGIGVYLHCWGGVGRTGTVVACWYMRSGISASAALQRVHATRRAAGYHRTSPDYHAQIMFVEQWQAPDAEQYVCWTRWRDAFRGTILGAALGNAVGVTNDMRNPKVAQPVATLQGGGLFDIAAGGWTDETAMMLCVAESLIQMRGFDARDVAERFLRWWRDGYMTCTGRVYEVGNTTRMALFSFQQTGDPLQGVRSATTSGNGSITRVGPLALTHLHAPAELLHISAMNSLITHGTQTAIDGCRYVAWLLALLCRGVDKYTALATPWPYDALADDVAQVAAGSYRSKSRSDIRTSIDVSDTLETALWSLWHCDDFASGALVIANLGGLCESCGQLYGTLAGAAYGEHGLPDDWLLLLQKRDQIGWIADELLRTSWKHLPIRL